MKKKNGPGQLCMSQQTCASQHENEKKAYLEGSDLFCDALLALGSGELLLAVLLVLLLVLVAGGLRAVLELRLRVFTDGGVGVGVDFLKVL